MTHPTAAFKGARALVRQPMQGKKQTALAIQKYHIRCAALQNKYVIRDITPIAPITEPTADKHRKSKPMTYRSTLWFSV
jgi:hypothetical protein